MRLTPQQTANAVHYNTRNARKVGWADRYAQIASIFGLDRMTPSPEGFAQAVADWQAANPPLKPDGKLGPKTWTQLEPHTRFSTAPVPLPGWLQQPSVPISPRIAPAPRAGTGPAWMQIAEAERQRWNTEIASWTDQGRARNAERFLDWDEAYFAAAPMWGGRVHEIGDTPREGRNLHWCAAFVNYCLHRAGYSHTGSAGAGSFVQSGSWAFQALEEPREGCVIVVGNASPAHVAFLQSFRGLPRNPGGDVQNTESVTIRLLGGNQSDRITISNDRRNLLSARGRNGVVSPYLWPEVGAPNCNISLPTEQAHYCRYIHS